MALVSKLNLSRQSCNILLDFLRTILPSTNQVPNSYYLLSQSFFKSKILVKKVCWNSNKSIFKANWNNRHRRVVVWKCWKQIWEQQRSFWKFRKKIYKEYLQRGINKFRVTMSRWNFSRVDRAREPTWFRFRFQFDGKIKK